MKSKKAAGTTAPSKKHLEALASDTLSFFETVANAANSELLVAVSGPEVLAAINTFTTGNAVQELADVHAETRRQLRAAASEPAIARVVVEESGRRTVYYIAHATVRTDDRTAQVANYRAPLGRLAALPVGDEYVVPTGRGERILTVIEKTTLKPSLRSDGWDALDSRLEHVDHLPKTIVSLRLANPPRGQDLSSGLDIIDRLLAEANFDANVVEGFRRAVITKMGLRAAAALDKLQDEIFRLPLTTRLILMGPPGTGKTTTLIKRLGLKLDYSYLGDDEKRAIDRTAAGRDGLTGSWTMFAPTELLAQYVKENFNKEGIAAPDERIRTWTSFRQDAARRNLGILRTGLKRNGLVMKDSVASIAPSTLGAQVAWYVDFEEWQQAAFWDELSVQARILSEADDPSMRRVGGELERHLSDAPADRRASVFVDLMITAAGIAKLGVDIRAAAEKRAREALAHQLTDEPELLTALADFASTMQDEGDEDDSDADDDEERPPSRSPREAAFRAYIDAVNALARSRASGRRISPRSRSGRLIAWIGSRFPADDELVVLGKNLRALSAILRFTNPVSRYLGSIPRRYGRYRKLRQSEGSWYVGEGFGLAEVHPLEVDLIILARLRATTALLSDRRISNDLAEPRYAALRSVTAMHRAQIVIDEATDFSPVQLACMAELSDPAVRSFTACGDFLQRITPWGSRSREDLALIGNIELKTVSTTYRHSNQLNEFAHAIDKLEHPDAVAAELPQHVDNDGVPPAFGKELRTDAQVADWIAARIGEIETVSGGFPSVAVLVETEERVVPVANALNEALAHTNLTALACQGGLAVGQDNQVRIFDVQHIKGLEFEAVFFVGLDRLAEQNPDLLTKFLYVGATRAALFLGLGISGSRLPPSIRSLENMLVDAWKR